MESPFFVSSIRDLSLGRSTPPGGCDRLDRVSDGQVDPARERRAVQDDRDPGGDLLTVVGARKNPRGQVDGVAGIHAHVTGENTDECDVVYTRRGDPSGETLARAFHTWNVKVRQKIVDPFMVGFCRKSSYVNVIEARQIYP